ncbi:GNAT family N-acetyltransferase [Candidatus Thorarchaeota archaeon]|nr:MAG: GNAT family N-acetyltransferase [Candidatus Thorarchaeota archaeon]
MDIEVRLATAQERNALEEFYTGEGLNFHEFASQASCTPMGAKQETMFVVAVTQELVVAALKLDIGTVPKLGKIGFIQHFEIDDELEHTDLGLRMLNKIIEIADEKGLIALDTLVTESRQDVIDLYIESGFKENRKEVYLRKDFRARIF